jgi:hypothetical protein
LKSVGTPSNSYFEGQSHPSGFLPGGGFSYHFDIDGAADGDGMAELSPLYVLLAVMRQRWGAGDLDGAVALARIAAPYLHGKAPVSRPDGDLAEAPDEDLDAWSSGGGADSEAADQEEPG